MTDRQTGRTLRRSMETYCLAADERQMRQRDWLQRAKGGIAPDEYEAFVNEGQALLDGQTAALLALLG